MESRVAAAPITKLGKLVITLVVGAAAGGHHLASSHADAKYMFVDELFVQGLRPNADHELKVHGFVEAGSVVERSDGYTFQLARRGLRLGVTVRDPPVEAIRDHADVIVTGRLVEDGGWRLEGSVIAAKCGGWRDSQPRRDSVFR